MINKIICKHLENKRFNRVMLQDCEGFTPPNKNWLWITILILMMACGACLLAVAFALDSQAGKIERKVKQQQQQHHQFYNIIKSTYKL